LKEVKRNRGRLKTVCQTSPNSFVFFFKKIKNKKN